MLALRKRRMAATIPLLRGGFRPFFLGSASWGLIALALWLCSLAGEIQLPTRFDPLAWHRHELLFGFIGSAIAGFLLTAIPNWTGRLPIAGKPLLGLFAIWVGARFALLFSAIFGIALAAALDIGFFAILAGLCAREVLAAKNRNVPVVGMAFLYALADAADYAGKSGILKDIGWESAILLVITMISIIGGRIIPSFTHNWMVKQGIRLGLPTQPAAFDLLAIAGTVIALLFWIVVPGDHRTGALLILASLLQLARLQRWGGFRTYRDPLVLILHLGYFWIPVGLFLLGLSTSGFDVPRSAAIHALTAGAMSTMVLAVMTRATLGHTGRALKASSATIVIYGCVTLGALLRVGVSLGLEPSMPLLDLAGTAWAAAMIIFLAAYGPMLWRARST